MSLSYGNFSHALNSTVNSGIIKAGTLCYFTVPWYPASYVERIRIQVIEGTITGNYTQLAILANGAHERQGDFTSADDYIYIDATAVTPTGNSTGFWNISNPVYFDDKYARPYLHIKLIVQTSISNAKFQITVQGRKSFASKYTLTDITGVKKLKDYRVLKSSTGGTYDITSNSMMNSSTDSSNFNLTTSQYIMIGSENKIDHWDFGVSTGSTNAVSLLGELWNGSAWSSFTVLDNTGAGSTQTMRYSGVVEGYGIGSSTWATTTIATDPLTILQNNIINGDAVPIGMLYNPARYWTRFSISAMNDTANFKYILPVEDVY